MHPNTSDFDNETESRRYSKNLSNAAQSQTTLIAETLETVVVRVRGILKTFYKYSRWKSR